ncbi:MAG: beta-N-acetylglucosaminidase domain-containing protein [Bacteroidaceae bacterium]|nr:beta-N-acetylglucosaminidase domain-containing protein [Bacteroidaceae bacterium]
MIKHLNKAFLAAVILASAVIPGTTNAQTTNVYPVPQSIQWSGKVAFNNDVTYTITGAGTADTDAVNLFNRSFSTGNGTVEVIIGERSDEAVAEYADLIPQKSEGYYLAIEGNKVVIAGNDGSGTFYGVQTYRQIASQPQVMEVTVTDYPSVPQRGLVEGYYGNPYSKENRMGLFEMFGRQKMNVYIYGPKDDAYHKGKWREEYPATQAAQITEYVNAAKANKVEFVWAIHPGEDIQWNDTDRANIVNKLKAMCKLGVRTFAVFWDDLWNDDGSHGDEQAELMNYIAQQLEAAYPDVRPMIICPTQYNRGWANAVYLPALGNIMNPDINIMWTGNSVVDMINKGDMEWINGQIKRNAYIWLNYPVSDYCIDHLLMGPTYGNDLDIADMMSGFVANPMEYAEASKVSLFSIGDYCWNMPAYDADTSWEAALKYIMPENYEAFRFFCENNVDLGPNVHGLRRTNESPEFVEAEKIYRNNIENDRATAFAAIAEQFNKFTNSAETLLATDEAEELTSEIEPWLQTMKHMGLRGIALVEMNNALAEENPEKFIENYLKYQENLEAQSAIRSRDFAGSLRVASPAVGSLHVEPFLKECAGELVAKYKESYDYRLDVFPAQVLENGTYYIMHNGRYLTNTQPNVASSAPIFKSAVDTIRPQRQEWKISLDASTGRYKIVNVEDSRYLNEKGAFTVSNDTNPYEAVWHTYEITLLANGKYAIQNAGSAGTKFWTVSGTRIQQSSSSEALPDKYIFDLVPLGGEPKENMISDYEVYYIMDGNRYLTNNNVNGSGGTPTFKEVITPKAAQEWKIKKESGYKNCYKITSNADGRYLNEYGVFGTNQYYGDWNTYLLTIMGDMWSLGWTQSAAKNGIQYIIVSGNRLEAKGVARAESYTVKIVRKGDETAVEEITQSENGILIADGTITGANGITGIAVYSTDGKLIKKADGHRISTAGIAKGIYIVVTERGNMTERHKFIIRQ